MALEKRSLGTARAGFSLLELAVVLAILGVVVTLGLDIGQSAMRGSERISTQEKLSIIQQALELYAERNGYLPCPAGPALLPTNANFGFEEFVNSTAGSNCGTSNGVVNASSTFIGMVPVRNLGLPDGYASDAWGNKILYAVSSQHVRATGIGMNSYYANNPTITINTGTRSSSYTISTLNTGAAGAGATYVVLSHGPNGRGAYPLNGTAIAVACSGATLIDVENCDRSNATFFASSYNEGAQTTTHFDDYIVWGSNANKRNPVAVLPNSCPSGCESWCAPCTVNIGATTSVPVTATRICAKFINRTSPCQATCIWPGATLPCP